MRADYNKTPVQLIRTIPAFASAFPTALRFHAFKLPIRPGSLRRLVAVPAHQGELFHAGNNPNYVPLPP